MTVARSVADVLAEHVVFEVECIDRMFCNVYVPGLQYAAGLVGYVHRQLGLPIASTHPTPNATTPHTHPNATTPHTPPQREHSTTQRDWTPGGTPTTPQGSHGPDTRNRWMEFKRLTYVLG